MANVKKLAIRTYKAMPLLPPPYEDKHCHKGAAHFHHAFRPFLVNGGSKITKGLLILHSRDCRAFEDVPYQNPWDRCHDIPGRRSSFCLFQTRFTGLLPLLGNFFRCGIEWLNHVSSLATIWFRSVSPSWVYNMKKWSAALSRCTLCSFVNNHSTQQADTFWKL